MIKKQKEEYVYVLEFNLPIQLLRISKHGIGLVALFLVIFLALRLNNKIDQLFAQLLDDQKTMLSNQLSLASAFSKMEEKQENIDIGINLSFDLINGMNQRLIEIEKNYIECYKDDIACEGVNLVKYCENGKWKIRRACKEGFICYRGGCIGGKN